MNTDNREQIQKIIKSYLETERKIRSGTLPHHVTNVGDIQAMKLHRIRELGSHWYPPMRMH